MHWAYAGLPPPPELPLPPGLDSASAAPYQQRPIDLFKAIFEASDSEEDEDAEVDADKGKARAKTVNGQLGASAHAGPAAGAEDGGRPGQQSDNGAGTSDPSQPSGLMSIACLYCPSGAAMACIVILHD